jgi:hypothetical protein
MIEFLSNEPDKKPFCHRERCRSSLIPQSIRSRQLFTQKNEPHLDWRFNELRRFPIARTTMLLAVAQIGAECFQTNYEFPANSSREKRWNAGQNYRNVR